MAGQKLPLALIEARGVKRLTKAEKAERERLARLSLIPTILRLRLI